MGKKLRILLILLFVACFCIGAIIWQMWSPSVPDPIYKGKPLSYWLTGFVPDPVTGTNPPPPQVKWEAAREAVQHLGTNALPLLLQILREPDHPLKERLCALAAKQHFIKIHQPVPAFIRKHRAINALSELRTNVIPVISQMMEIYDRHPGVLSDQIVPGVLSMLGPPAEIAIPMLIRGTSHTNAFVRQNSALALGNIHAQPELVVPVLIRCLQDPFPNVQANASFSLGQFGSKARPAVPAMLQLLQSLPAKSPARTSGGFSIQHIGGWSVGEGAIPFSPSVDVRGAFEEAIKAIDPGAALKAGIK